MKKRIIFFGIILVAAVGAFAVYQYQKPSANVVTSVAEFEVTATDLFEQFDSNETEANAKYLNKVVEVTGRVASVQAADSTGVDIVLQTDNPMFGVNCNLPQLSISEAPKKGETIVVTGLCTGKLMDVVLVKCFIRKK